MTPSWSPTTVAACADRFRCGSDEFVGVVVEHSWRDHYCPQMQEHSQQSGQ
jgi:hypothetical protein